MPIKFFTVDAFAEQAFSGNQAAVCILEKEMPDVLMQSVAKEINYSETAFVRPIENGFSLRWFTPGYEVDLCGHATLATSHVLWNELNDNSEQLRFETRSGQLLATRKGESIKLDFPATPPVEEPLSQEIIEALGVSPVFMGKSRFDAFVVVASESEVRSCRPDFGLLEKSNVRGVIVTARSLDEQFDFISRFFAPGAGVDEDPVTGSAHCCLAPYWSKELAEGSEPKLQLRGFQASERGGIVGVELKGERAVLSGQAITIVRGELAVS
ncbi:MAG: PhzF family phenazine biosynthesis protein [Planctomycetota bacterium]